MTTPGFTQFVRQWCGQVGLDPDLAWRQMRSQPGWVEAQGAHKAMAAPKVVGEWLEVAAREAGLFEKR